MNQILNAFKLDAPVTSCERYGCGHVNETYLVVSESGRRYILQKISTRAFHDVPALMQNIISVTQFLKEKTDDPRGVLTLVPTGVCMTSWRTLSACRLPKLPKISIRALWLSAASSRC